MIVGSLLKPVFGYMTRRRGPFVLTEIPTFSGRTREGALLRGIRAELIGHVGGRPDAAQVQTIETIAHARLRLTLMDQQLAETGSLGDQTSYLGLTSNVARLMARLEPATPAAPTLADILRTPPASKAPEPVQAVAGATAPAAADKPLAGILEGHRDVA
jgi:hypothetical protein